MGMFSKCCKRSDDVDFATLRRRGQMGRVVRRMADDGAMNVKQTVVDDDCSSTDSESVGEPGKEHSDPPPLSSAEAMKEFIAKKLASALCLEDDEGNIVTPMDSLNQAKGVLESFSHPDLQSSLAEMITNFLFHHQNQNLYVSSCTKGKVSLAKHEETEGSEIAYKLSGRHEYIAHEKVNLMELEQELAGMLRVQELFKFIRNINSIASSTEEPVYEDDLLDALSQLLPKLSKLLSTITSEGSGDFWIDRDEETKSVHVRMEAELDITKIASSEYSSVADTLKRAHSLDIRVMKLPEGTENMSKEELRDQVKKKSMNDFPASLILKVLSTRHAMAHGGERSKKGRNKQNCLIRMDFCIEENGSDLLWMNPRTCLPELDGSGRNRKVNFNEDLHDFKGRSLLGFELTAGVSELGCATISLPKVIALLEYEAHEAIDGSGVAATLNCSPLYIDWNRMIKLLARPLIDLSKLEKLLLSDFEFQMRFAPKSDSLEEMIQMRGLVPGFGLFPDLPKELDPWTLRMRFCAKMVRPASIVTAFVRTFVAGQVDDFGELILWRDLTVAFVGDLQEICVVKP